MPAKGKKAPPRDPDLCCGAKNRGTDKRCKNWKGFKTDHPGFGRCYKHSGTAKHGRIAGRREMIAARLAEAVVTFGLPRQIDPHDALLEEVWRSAGHVSWLEDRVRQLNPDDLVWGITKETARVIRLPVNPNNGHDAVDRDDPIRETERRSTLNTWLQLYYKERAHLVEVCKTAIACGIAERNVKIAEEFGATIARVIGGVLGDLGVDQDAVAVRATVQRHLSLAAGTDAR